MPFSKLKASLRKAAERTIPRLRRRIGTFAGTVTVRESCNYFRHAGSGTPVMSEFDWNLL